MKLSLFPEAYLWLAREGLCGVAADLEMDASLWAWRSQSKLPLVEGNGPFASEVRLPWAEGGWRKAEL